MSTYRSRMIATVSPLKPPDDGRGIYPASIRVGVTRELPAQIHAAADAEGISLSEFVRRAIAVRLESVRNPDAFL